MDKKEIKVAECFGIDMKDRLCVVDRFCGFRLVTILCLGQTTSVAVLGVHGDDGSSSSSSSSSGSSSNRRNRLTHYPVLVPPRWPVFVVVVPVDGAGGGQGKLSSLLVRYLVSVSVLINIYIELSEELEKPVMIGICDDGRMILGWPIGMEWNEKEGELFNDTRKGDGRERY
uniref:Bm8080, isoform b n=1 Tax=Brugia malayi TaxID=6279 RepID=A0A1I9G8H3_BRUMA|nr:Bm8080, isoform b [Brugia malayi]